MKTNEFNIKGIKLTIIEKPEFTVYGFFRPVNLDGGMIGNFINELKENGKIKKLEEIAGATPKTWVCLSDCSPEIPFCDNCDNKCEGFHTRCLFCVMDENVRDTAQLRAEGLFAINLPASEWAVFEFDENGGDCSILEKIGYEWNKKLMMHFDDEHDWEPGKKVIWHFPVSKIV